MKSYKMALISLYNLIGEINNIMIISLYKNRWVMKEIRFPAVRNVLPLMS